MNTPTTTRERTEPTEFRASIMRKAGDLIGSEQLAAELGVKPRTVYHWMAGSRSVSDSIIAETREILTRRRQLIGTLIQVIREEEACAAMAEARKPKGTGHEDR